MAEPTFPDLRAYLEQLRRDGDLAVVAAPVDARLEAAEIHRRVIAAGGPALLFTNVRGAEMPLATNLFGTARRAEMAFGREEATGLPQRGLRLLEEAIEAFQACGGDEAIAQKLVAFVFARPKGTIGQELGGVAVTVLALAAAAGVSADEEECREIHHVLSKPLGEFTQRNADKNAAGFKIP